MPEPEAQAKPTPAAEVAPETEDTSEYVPPPVDRQKAEAVAAQIMKFVKTGQAMESLRHGPTEKCVQKMNILRPTAAPLQAEAKAVNGAPALYLGAAAMRLMHCLSCTRTAMENCERAAKEVKEGLDAVEHW